MPNKLFSIHSRIGVRVAHVCLSCKVAVQARAFPSRPLFETKREARAEAERARDELEASGFDSVYVQSLYERGRCTCAGRSALLPRRPCPQHAPLPKRSRR